MSGRRPVDGLASQRGFGRATEAAVLPSLLAAVVAVVATVCAVRTPDAPAAQGLTPAGEDGFSETVLRGVRFGAGPRSLAVDGDGVVHAFLGGTALRHAWHDGSGWRMETIDDPGVPVEEPSAAVDPSGRVHVAYFVSFPGVVRHGTLGAGTFESEDVAAGVEALAPPSAIAVGAEGTVHVAWVDVAGVHLADDGGGGFAATTIAADASWNTDVDLALDGAGRPHLVYQSSAVPSGTDPVRALVHAERTDAGWIRTTVESSNLPGGFGTGAAAALAFDAAGDLHVVASGGAVHGAAVPLRHATRSTGTWSVETVGEAFARRSRLLVGAGGELRAAVTTGGGPGIVLRSAAGPWTATEVGGIAAPLAMAFREGSCHVAWAYAGDAFAAQSDGTAAPGGEDLAFATTVLGIGSEPVARVAVAAGDDGTPHVAIVRDDAGGVHLDVLDRRGGGWEARSVATDVLATTPPALVMDRTGRVHVAWESPDLRIRCATEGPAGFEAVDVAAGLLRPSGSLALAVAPDGTRRVAWFEDLHGPGLKPNPVLRVAKETAGGWVAESLGPADLDATPCDVEVGHDGTTHVAWLTTYAIHHASDASGSWTSERVGWLPGGWGVPSGPDLAVDGDGSAWIAASAEAQFETWLSVTTNRSGSWSSDFLGNGRSPRLGVSADGTARVVATADGIRRWVRHGGDWESVSVDAGPGRLRRLSPAAGVVEEGGAPLRFEVRSSRALSAGGPTMQHVGAAFDPAGAVHAAYVDPVTGDLRYATDRDPGLPRTVALDVLRVGGTASEEDVAFEPVRVGWLDEDDTGTKHADLAATADDFAESTESLFVELANPSPAIRGDGGRSVVQVVNVGGLLPPPRPAGTDDGAYFLPLRVRPGPRGGTTVSGVLHAGRAEFSLPAGIRVVAAGLALEFRDFRARGPRWEGRAGDSRISFSPTTPGATWIDVRLDLAREAGVPDLGGPAAFVCASETFVASSTVVPRSGRLRIPDGVGGFSSPDLHLASLTTRSGDPGSVTMTVFLSEPMPLPSEAGGLRISVDPLFSIDVPAGTIRRRGGVLTARSRDRHVTLDLHRRLLRIDARDVAVASVAGGPLDVEVSVAVGDDRRSLRSRVFVVSGRVRSAAR